jgi:hypothetical protein
VAFSLGKTPIEVASPRYTHRENALAVVFLFLTACVVTSVLGQTQEIPRLSQTDGHYRVLVDGKPFFILGAQVQASMPCAAGGNGRIVHIACLLY